MHQKAQFLSTKNKGEEIHICTSSIPPGNTGQGHWAKVKVMEKNKGKKRKSAYTCGSFNIVLTCGCRPDNKNTDFPGCCCCCCFC